MWPLNQPARDVLRLPGATSTPWAVFDADWYRKTYADSIAHLTGVPADAVLAFYFETGQRMAHSPNMLFDEVWHRRTYPGIAALVEAGQFPSAFDAWCRGGCCERSPHWLFDEPEYRRRYPDLTDAFLIRNGLVNGYDHYLWRGNADGRIGHPLFDPEVYRANLEPRAADEATADGPFWHCLRRMHRGEPEVRASPYFDAEWYLRRYPEVAEAIDRGTWRWALEHYLANGTPTKFDPVPAFSESYYLARYDDAAEMVRRGEIRNGFAHFLRHGIAERRAASEHIDLAGYAAREDVTLALEQGLAADPFAHWLNNHATDFRDLPIPPAESAESSIPEAGARALFLRRARNFAVLHARTKLHFETTGTPALSVVMVVHDQFEQTMMTLGSLRANHPGGIDLVLIDAGSTDETRDIQNYVRGATHFRFDTNIGLLAGRNAALQFATADTVLYLNSATEPGPGAIAAGLRRMEDNPRIGAVGGMLIRGDGLLWEAGGIVWRDGTTQAYARDASPLAPEANFVREVDYCSSVFLMARRALLNELEGFDARLEPGGHADADLCLRMKETGFPVVYDPAVMVHYLGDDNGNGGAHAAAGADDAGQTFARGHAGFLQLRPERDEANEVFARMANTTRKRVLFVEDTIPLRKIGSGFVRSNDIIREMAALGYAVTVYPLNGSRFNVASVYADMRDDVEVMHDRTLEQFSEFLRLRTGYYDVIWAARTHNFATVRAALDRSTGQPGEVPPVILDTEAITAVRDSGLAELEGEPFDFDAAVRSELRDASFCRKIVAINEAEATIMRDLGLPEVAVIGHTRELHPTPRSFSQRAGMLFVGAIHRMDSPNYDSLCWFIDEVLPLIARELTWETRLTVVGYTGPGVSMDRFREHPRVTLRGAVSDIEPLYDSHLVFVAPTRIAAGTPYKVHEAASFGLPVIATELLRRQLRWRNGEDLLAADADDPETFARHVVAAQRDEVLWGRLRDAALNRLRRENSREAYAAEIRDVLDLTRAAS